MSDRPTGKNRIIQVFVQVFFLHGYFAFQVQVGKSQNCLLVFWLTPLNVLILNPGSSPLTGSHFLNKEERCLINFVQVSYQIPFFILYGSTHNPYKNTAMLRSCQVKNENLIIMALNY
jgi:hypothetical protein